MGTENERPSLKEMGLSDKSGQQETKQEYEETLREIWKDSEGLEIVQSIGIGFKRIEDNDKREKFIDFLEEFRAEVKGIDAEAEMKFGEGFSVVFPETPDHPEISGKKVREVLSEMIKIQMEEE